MQPCRRDNTSNFELNETLLENNDSDIEINEPSDIDNESKKEIVKTLQIDLIEKSKSVSSDIKKTNDYLNFLNKYQYIIDYDTNELNNRIKIIPDNDKKENCKCKSCNKINCEKSNIFSMVYVISTILFYAIVIFGCIIFFYASFFIIFTIIMNGFCIMLFHDDHKWDIPVIFMWIIGSSPYIDVLVFVNFPVILIFLNYIKNKKNAKNLKSLYDYGTNLDKKNHKSIYIFSPIIICCIILIIFIPALLIAHFVFKCNFYYIAISILSTAFLVPFAAFILILYPLPLFWRSIRESARNKFDCTIDKLNKVLYDENENIINQKRFILNSNDNLIYLLNSEQSSSQLTIIQNENEENNPKEVNKSENNENTNQNFVITDLFKNKNDNQIEFNIKNENDHLITIEKLFYFLSIGEWYSFFIDKWNYYFNRKVYGEHYSRRKCKSIIIYIFSILVIILQFIRIIYDGIFTFKKRIYRKIDILYYTLRCIFKITTLIFVAFSNIISFAIDWKKIKTRYPNIYTSKIISIFIMASMTILMIISHFLSKYLFEREIIKSFNYNSTKIIQRINVTEKASICGINICNFSIIQMAGLSMIATITNKELQYNLTKQIFDEDITINTLNGTIISGLLVNKSNNYVVAYPGVWKKSHVGIIFETIGFKLYTSLIGNIIPFYNFFESSKKNIFWLKFMPRLYSILLIGKDVTEIFINDLTNHLKYLKEKNVENPVFTGQMIGGIASKFLEIKWSTRLKSWSVSFESPSLINSKIEHFAIDEDTDTHNPLRLINIFSDSSIFSSHDGNATFNFEMPVYQSNFKPATSHETFCLIAAGCTDTDSYDDICKDYDSSTYKKYADYFLKWKRIRKW